VDHVASVALRHQKSQIVLSPMLLHADSQAHGSSDIFGQTAAEN
jgi:hypothetical protein